jgi:2,5-furandicarboxylate decarboxylase 1
MTIRRHLQEIDRQNKLVKISQLVSKTYQASGLLKRLEPAPVQFSQIRESSFRVAGNLFSSKAAFASYFNLRPPDLIPTLLKAIENPLPCKMVEAGACQEVVDLQPDLDTLPILRHCQGDGGNYISSGVFIAHHPRYGLNADFHRCMQFSKTGMAVRVVKGRHFDAFLQDLGQVDVAICIGCPPALLAAGAISVGLGVNELEIANALEPLPMVRAATIDVPVPAGAEFILEGTVYRDRRHAEGPFVDLTETYDIIRQEPVFQLKAITHRHDAIWHALLPGALEHKLLMGMPREPTIFKKVNETVKCLDVNINPGGCSWLHAIVQIDKQYEDDGKRAIEAAFAGHSSCKHVFVVDKDIDIYNPLEVEWAMATRFQGDRDLVIEEKASGSSLDPSSETPAHLTTRLGFDLTKPLAGSGKSFDRAGFPEVDINCFLMEP